MGKVRDSVDAVKGLFGKLGKGNKPVNPTGPLAKTGAGAGVGSGIAKYGLYRGIGDAFSEGDTTIMPGEASSGIGGFGFGGGGGQMLTPAAAATSALSDADSSDPVVRQLQDIERVLVSIKGDTAMTAAGLSKLGSAGSGGPTRPMFAGPDKANMSKTTAALLAALAGATLAKSADGKAADRNADGIPDNQQDKDMVNVQKETDDVVIRAAGKGAAKGAEKSAQVLGEVAEGAVESQVKRRAAKAATQAGASVLEEVKVTAKPKESMILGADGKPLTSPEPKVNTTTGASSNKEIPSKLKAALDDGKIFAKEEILKFAPKYVGKIAAKAVPFLGAGVGMGFAIQKILNGDFIGAVEEAGNALAPGPLGILGDVGIAARDIYKEMYYPGQNTIDGYETDLLKNPEMANARMAKISEVVGEYFTQALEQMMGDGPVTVPVEARPEVTTPVGRGRMNNAKRLSEQKAQAEWDDKYGMTHNADGSLKDPEAAAAIEAERANSVHNSNIFERTGTRTEREMEALKEVGTEAVGAAQTLFNEVTDPNGLRVNAENVEITTDEATQASVDADTERMTGAMLAGSTVQGSTASAPSAQNPLSVSIVGSKSALPITDLHSMQMIANRGTFYLPA